MTGGDPRFDAWLAALEARHLADLTFPEVSRALRALSSTYVERRERLGEGAALAGAGKRAAFALFYAPLHYLLVREIVRALPAATTGPATLVDLGCGTGAAGAAWASASARPPRGGRDRPASVGARRSGADVPAVRGPRPHAPGRRGGRAAADRRRAGCSRRSR